MAVRHVKVADMDRVVKALWKLDVRLGEQDYTVVYRNISVQFSPETFLRWHSGQPVRPWTRALAGAVSGYADSNCNVSPLFER